HGTIQNITLNGKTPRATSVLSIWRSDAERMVLMKVFVALSVLTCAMNVDLVLAQKKEDKPAKLVVDIKNLKGEIAGKATLSPAEPRGVQLVLEISNLPGGSHAFHIHQKPVCDPDHGFKTAGLQYDPTGEMYGNAQHAPHSGHSAGDPRME